LTRKVALQRNVRRTLNYLDDELDESLCEEMEKAHGRLQALQGIPIAPAEVDPAMPHGTKKVTRSACRREA
jgi:hypothetical protein